MIAEVIVDIAHSEVDKIFDYDCGTLQLFVGQRVFVPFGAREIEGYIINFKQNSDYDSAKIKQIIKPLEDYPVIPSECIKLMHSMVSRFHLKLIDCIRLFIPAEMRGNRVKELTKNFVQISPKFLQDNNLLDTNFEDFDSLARVEFAIKKSALAQQEVFLYLAMHGLQPLTKMNKEFSAAALRNLIARGIVECKEFQENRIPYKNVRAEQQKSLVLKQAQEQAIESITRAQSTTFLLHGVTGSGKTEVYLNCMEDCINKGKTAIMLVPEIALTPQMLRALRTRFGETVALLHSGLSKGERFDEWQRLLKKQAKIAIGARSAVFAPLDDLGLIIIDEEHDNGYISENNPRYDTLQVAQMRKDFHGCNLVLGSATPSIATYDKALSGEYTLIELKNRVNNMPMPKIEIVDMAKEVREGNRGVFSAQLLSAIKECIDSNNQAMLFVNRRGFASYMLCRSCGYIAKCEHCDVSLVFHREENLLKCHYCNARYKALDVCPECKSESIRYGFVGTQRVETEITQLLKNARVLRMDKDTTSQKDAHDRILRDFGQGKANILVGTQMIAKGHDFPAVTLVGIIDADLSLYTSGYMGNQRTFELITQVAGRAGREEKEGKVILQSYQPKHYVYRFAKNYDYKGFFEKEKNIRQTTKYPPYSILVRILLSGDNEDNVLCTMKNVWTDIQALSKQNPSDFYYCGKMHCPIKKIMDKVRFQILLRLAPQAQQSLDKIYQICDTHADKKTLLTIELNPSQLG